MLFKELVKRKKFEINNCIEVDIAPLNGWKDWFLTEEDKVKDIHTVTSLSSGSEIDTTFEFKIGRD